MNERNWRSCVRTRRILRLQHRSEVVTLQVYTARLNCSDPDVFNVIRGSGGELAAPFAPSRRILTPVLAARSLGVDAAEKAWAEYVPAYTAEMRASWRAHPEAWRALLARPRVVLTCYCQRRERCHRGLLAEILAKRGAVDCGELAAAELRIPDAAVRTQDMLRDWDELLHRLAK
jgi:hypothetical protein